MRNGSKFSSIKFIPKYFKDYFANQRKKKEKPISFHVLYAIPGSKYNKAWFKMKWVFTVDGMGIACTSKYRPCTDGASDLWITMLYTCGLDCNGLSCQSLLTVIVYEQRWYVL